MIKEQDFQGLGESDREEERYKYRATARMGRRRLRTEDAQLGTKQSLLTLGPGGGDRNRTDRTRSPREQGESRALA